MSLFGVQLNAQLNRLHLQLRLQLSKGKFIPNFRTIYRSFAKFDHEISGQVTLKQFQNALNENGIFFKIFEFQVFHKAYQNNQGKIDWFVFMSHIRQPMGPFRRELVEKIYDRISSLNENKVTPQALLQNFNVHLLDVYKSKKMSQSMLQEQLISLLSLSQEGTLSKEQFIAYYDDLNVNYPHDEVFHRIISDLWSFTAQKYPKVTQQQVRGLIKSLRYKLIQKTNGTKDEFLMKKIFNEFDENRNGILSAYELDLMLKKLQMPAKPQVIPILFAKLDKNKSGFIEYQEFRKQLFFDPFVA